MKHKILSLILLFLFLSSFAVFSQDGKKEPAPAPAIPKYGLGDQTFSLTAGVFLPLFFFGGTEGAVPTNLTIGAAGALTWGAFLTNHLTLGGELAGSFAFTPLMRTLALIPITAKVSYYFFIPPFEIPIYLGTGVYFSTLDDMYYIGWIVKPGISFYWKFNANWAIGLNTVYWFTPQWYTRDLSDQSRYGNFLEISVSALYHF